METLTAGIRRIEQPPDATPRNTSDTVQASVAVLRTSDGGCFTVLKETLSACSRYFDTLFNGQLSEARRDDFLIPGVNKEALESITTYANVGNVPITVDDVQDLTVAADQLLVDGLLSECCSFISRNLDLDNCVSILEMAHFFYLEPLHKQALRFVLDNFETVYSDNGDFRKMSFENLESLLASDELKVRREEVAWEATKFWIDARPGKRRKFLGKLLQHIRLCLMDGSYLKKIVMRDPLVSANLQCKTMVERCHMICQSEHDARLLDPSRSLFVQRVPADIMFVYGGIYSEHGCNTWEVYNLKTNEWNIVQTEFRQDQVFGLKCVSVGHRIYVMGADTVKLLPFCYCFDAVSMKWLSIKPMKQLRAFFGIAVLDHFVYCIGGSHTGNGTLDTAEEYDTVTDSWRTVGRMNHPRFRASASSCAGRVYIAGGIGNGEILRSAETYDRLTDQWTLVAPMKTERLYHSMVTYRGKLYVVGGLCCKSSFCEVYDPKHDKWSEGSNTKTFSNNVVAVVLDDKIYAIGETNQTDREKYTRCLEYYSGDDRKWHAIPGYLPPLWSYSACVLRNLPNAKEYINRPNQTD